MHATFKLKYRDGSSRLHIVNLANNSSFSSSLFREDILPIAFEYCPLFSVIETPIDSVFIKALQSSLLWRFHTNPILWAISLSTCPEELHPFLTLEPNQLTYKGSN
jgi:hypothetical protein